MSYFSPYVAIEAESEAYSHRKRQLFAYLEAFLLPLMTSEMRACTYCLVHFLRDQSFRAQIERHNENTKHKNWPWFSSQNIRSQRDNGTSTFVFSHNCILFKTRAFDSRLGTFPGIDRRSSMFYKKFQATEPSSKTPTFQFDIELHRW